MRIGVDDLTLLSESGLYKLIMRSDKATARPFQEWVTRVVLPGDQEGRGYIMGEYKETASGGMGSRSRLQGMTERPLH